MPEDKSLRKLQVSVTARQADALKVKAEALQISISELTRRVLDAWIEGQAAKVDAVPTFPIYPTYPTPYVPQIYPTPESPWTPQGPYYPWPPGTVIYTAGNTGNPPPSPPYYGTVTGQTSTEESLPVATPSWEPIKRGPGRPRKKP